jgi:hypothetical protein
VNASNRARILLIEDEGKTARAVLSGLKAEGFVPVWAETAEDGFFLLSSQHFDAVSFSGDSIGQKTSVRNAYLRGQSGKKIAEACVPRI